MKKQILLERQKCSQCVSFVVEYIYMMTQLSTCTEYFGSNCHSQGEALHIAKKITRISAKVHDDLYHLFEWCCLLHIEHSNARYFQKYVLNAFNIRFIKSVSV